MMLVRVEAGHTVLPERLAIMLVRHTVLPERLAMILVRVEADHTVLPERLAMMLVAVCGRSGTINFSGSVELPTEWDHFS